MGEKWRFVQGIRQLKRAVKKVRWRYIPL